MNEKLEQNAPKGETRKDNPPSQTSEQTKRDLGSAAIKGAQQEKK